MKLAVDGFTTYDEEESLKTARIVELFFDRAGKLCTISNSGDKIYINRLNGPRFSATSLVAPNGITYWGWGWYQTMLQDHAGEWWMPMGEGLVRYPRLDHLEQLTHERPKAIYTTRDGLPANDIFRIFEDSRGDIWISTLGNSRVSLTRWERSDES